MHGHGILTLPNGTVEEGEWVKGKKKWWYFNNYFSYNMGNVCVSNRTN